TAIALTIMQERNILPTSTGQAGFAILLFQDIAAIPMIALVPLLGVADDQPDGGWGAALKAVLVMAAVVLGSRWVLGPLLDVVARIRMREIFTATALALVISTALLMQWA